MCVHSRRECVPSLQEIDSHEAEMISTPIRVHPLQTYPSSIDWITPIQIDFLS